MRYFNTSGPNNSEKHYTLKRKQLIREGIRLVKDLLVFHPFGHLDKREKALGFGNWR